MAAQTSTVSAFPRSLLVTWANQQDEWVKQLVSEVILSKKIVADAKLDSLYDLFLREKGLTSGDPVGRSKLGDDQNIFQANVDFSLVRLDNLQHVNALAQDQVLDFNPKLTIVFGENASGKTGYVRVLKQAAAVRTAEPVLPNLSTPTQAKSPPSARIRYRLGQDEVEIEWKGQAGLSPFTRIDVFDSRATALHVDGDLNYVYTPGDLARFPLVQEGIENVRGRLQEKIRETTKVTNRFLPHFDRQSRIYPLIDSLGASTDLQELKSLAVVLEQELAEVSTLNTEIEALRSTNPTALVKLAERQKENLEALAIGFSALGHFDAPASNLAIDRLRIARRQYEEATQKSFAGVPIPGVLQEEWTRFIQAGEDYLRTLEVAASYPGAADQCTYCHQPLSPAAVELLKKYRDYCNNTFRIELTASQKAVELIQTSLQQNFDSADLGRRMAEVFENGGSFTEENEALIKEFLEKGDRILASLAQRADVVWTDQAESMEKVRTVLGYAQTQNESLLTNLSDRREKRDQALRERETKLLDIESRLKLQTLLPEIEKFVEDAKWVDKAKIQQQKFQGLLRSITESSKAASEELLNRDFERHFDDECKRLRAPAVTLQFPGRQGQVTRKKAVAIGHKPSETLSEGEQKVIALADFLAEVSLKPFAPVIFDDPINSLDYRRMSEVVERIVQLCQDRQVIVFTHNIWFTTELLTKFEKRLQDCSYFDVSRDGSRIGVVSKGNHPRADTMKSLKGRINELIQNAEKSTGEAHAATIEKGYELIRNICEVFVESEVLQGVTQRYQPNVMMTRLPNINFSALENTVQAIYPIYEDCCRYIGSHSQPLETLNVRPTLETLKEDWKTILRVRDAYIKKS